MTTGACDGLSRAINYLRLSVTDRCNLRCVYCMPEEGVPLKRHGDVLRYEEMERLVRIAAGLGIAKVRLTGGEPLARAGLADLVAMLAAIPGIDDLAMTTNGTMLAGHAEALARAGLRRVNISLDTLRPERFRDICRRGELADVLAGAAAAEAAGLRPVRFNMVVARGMNDDEVADFARRSVSHGWHVRFIEVMPLGAGALWAGDGHMPASEIRRRIESELGPLEPGPIDARGPARYWRVPGAAGTIGFITPVSEHFCHYCNRLRLTADGLLLPCLLGGGEVDLRAPMRAGASDDDLRRLFLEAIAGKPAGHNLSRGGAPECRQMSGIGG